MLKDRARLVSGAIVFIDIDDYLAHVQDMAGFEELAWSEPAHAAVSEEALLRSFQPVRTFGDAFLLFVEGPHSSVKEDCLDYLGAIQKRFALLHLSFKAVIAGGQFYVGSESWDSRWQNSRISGALANLAGKKIRTVQRGNVSVLWPRDDSGVDLTYRQLSAGGVMSETIIRTDHL